MENESRDKIIVRTSVIGIITNAFLAGFKAFVGVVTGSIAITLDAVNNMSDMLSSLITIIGTKLAGKPADKGHPFGYGRAEYLSALIIAVIILYAGITALTESIKKILDPAVPEYTKAALIIVALATIVKVLLGTYVKKTGLKVDSEALKGSGQDALNDAIISAATLLAAIIFISSGVSIEAYLGVLIALIIVKAGFDMMRSTISAILGRRIDSELATGIKSTISSFKDVGGAYDLILHNYGPNMMVGSIQIEIPDTYTADMIDELTRSIQFEVYQKYNVVLAGVGIYSMNTKDDRAAELKTRITEIVMAHEGVIQMHGFYLDEKKKVLSFDIVVAFTVSDRKALYDHIHKEIHELMPEYHVHVTMDADISD